MNSRKVLDVSRLPAIAFMHKTPLFWAACGVAIIEGTMFGLLTASYYYARLNVDVWPPPGTQFPHTLLPTIELVLLIVSCLPAYWASEAAKKNEVGKVGFHMLVNGVLAIAAMVLRVIEWSRFNFDWRTDIHGSVVWTILGLHTFDVAGAIVVTMVVVIYVYTGRFSDTHRKGVDFDSVTWYFLVAIWIPLYATIYIAPHLVKAS